MSREAMQIALDALEANLGNWAAKTKAVEVLRQALGAEQKTAVSPGKGTGFNYFRASAITVLRQAQEPVAFINVEEQKLEWAKLTLWHTPTVVKLPKIPLYTAPPDYERGFVDGMQRQMQSSVDKALNEKQEPVAWANSFDLQNFDMKVRTCPDLHHTVPLYTAPPKREWVGLTDEEISEVIDDVLEGGGWLDVSRALEAAIKRKNT